MRLHPASRASLSAEGDGRFRLSGWVGFTTVMAMLDKSRELFREAPEITVDLADVEHINSSGLALLVEWLRWAKREERSLHFENVPAGALAMARICEIEPLLAPALAGAKPQG
ncbi:MAG: STAS domain-containing protein [Gammaproteobacteria bacterium]